MVIAEGFADLLAAFRPEDLDRHHGTVYGLWPDFTLALFNAGWFRFARENGGEPAVSTDWGLGAPLMATIPSELRPFYDRAYRKCLAVGEPWRHTYECSSPQAFRLFQQTAHPLGGNGLLVVNSLVRSSHLDAIVPDARPEHYRDGQGMIHQCCHCRRTRRQGFAERWDWVPEWVALPPPETTHGLCRICYGFYYPGLRGGD